MAKLSQKNLSPCFEKFVKDNDLFRKGDSILVACSGGPDSVCLFYLLATLAEKYQLKLSLAHYNHALRGGEADRDEKLVEKMAKKFSLKFISGRAKVGEIKSEESARNLRYKFLEEARGEVGADWIVTAHNKNDLAETMLINLARGVGVGGLSSIPMKRGKIIRPLLFADKKEILKFLHQEGIKYRIDKTNQSLIPTRNIMRHKVLPQLEKINPRVLDALSRTARLSEMMSFYLRSSSLSVFERMAEKKHGKIILSQKKFASLSPAIQYEIIRILAEKYATRIDLGLETVESVVEIINNNIGGKKIILSDKAHGTSGGLKFELKAGKVIVQTIKMK